MSAHSISFVPRVYRGLLYDQEASIFLSDLYTVEVGEPRYDTLAPMGSALKGWFGEGPIYFP